MISLTAWEHHFDDNGNMVSYSVASWWGEIKMSGKTKSVDEEIEQSGGRIVREQHRTRIEFDQDADATWFIMRWS